MHQKLQEACLKLLVRGGGLTPIETTRVMGLIDSSRRTLELTDIETRVAALEADLANSA